MCLKVTRSGKRARVYAFRGPGPRKPESRTHFSCKVLCKQRSNISYFSPQDNVLISPDSSALLCDFEIEEFLATCESKWSSAYAGQEMITYRYSSPELLSYQQPSKESDVWAFGMIIFVSACVTPYIYSVSIWQTGIHKQGTPIQWVAPIRCCRKDRRWHATRISV